MKPTIGRVVHYQRHGSPDGTHKSEPSPAIITKVNEDGTVSLAVFNPTGMYFQAVAKQAIADPIPGCWNWPIIEGEK